jgi:hypothetical protein
MLSQVSLIALQSLAILTMIGLTFVVFQSLGRPRENLLYTCEERDRWRAALPKALRAWFTQTNIFGTLMVFATVYLFFIGNSKLFGYWVYLCAITIWLGSFVTNFVTRRICSDPHVMELLNQPTQAGGVVACLFWRDSSHEKQTAALIKALSLLNISATIWLDFALFADIAGHVLAADSLPIRIIILAFCSFAIFYFTARYGLRGFVFADFFQAPIIVVATIALVIGAAILVVYDHKLLSASLIEPALPRTACILFAAQVIFLNSLLVLTTEPHWLRRWIFGDAETDLQVKSLSGTAIIWVLLICVGLVASQISGGKYGEDAITGLFDALNSVSPVFIVLFWLGGVAALFSSADSQIYSFMLVNDFDVQTGRLRQRKMTTINPFRLSLIFTLGFALVYGAMRYFNAPLEKIIFLIVPFSLNLVPAFVLALFGRRQHPAYIGLSVGLYVLCSIAGLMQPAQQFTWTLTAALMPFVASVVALVVRLA